MIYSTRHLIKRFLTYQLPPHKKFSVDENEVSKFSRLSGQWWDESGFSGPLHAMNSLRVPLVCNGLKNTGVITPENAQRALPLRNLHILDVGCGGGILSEALARLGAEVCGIDPSTQSIEIASQHSALDSKIFDKLSYKSCTAEDLAVERPGYFDAVVASEVAEHTTNVQDFVSTCVTLLKPGGSIFLTTINKTWLSYILTIFVAEYLLQIVPFGTHEWKKYVTVEEMQKSLSICGCETRLVSGMFYNPSTKVWSWMENTCTNYALHAVKEKK